MKFNACTKVDKEEKKKKTKHLDFKHNYFPSKYELFVYYLGFLFEHLAGLSAALMVDTY